MTNPETKIQHPFINAVLSAKAFSDKHPELYPARLTASLENMQRIHRWAENLLSAYGEEDHHNVFLRDQQGRPRVTRIPFLATPEVTLTVSGEYYGNQHLSYSLQEYIKLNSMGQRVAEGVVLFRGWTDTLYQSPEKEPEYIHRPWYLMTKQSIQRLPKGVITTQHEANIRDVLAQMTEIYGRESRQTP